MAALATANSASASTSTWLTDTGCLDHVTSDLSHLSLHSQVTIGNESVTVGNGQELPMTHIGNGKLLTPSHQFLLDNILRVPDLVSNLLSIHKPCLQNNAYCYFDATQFLIVDLPTGKVLYQGQSKDGVHLIPFSYQLSTAPTPSSSFAFQSSINMQFLLKHCYGIKDLDILAPSFFNLPYLLSIILSKFLLMMTFVHNVHIV